MAGTDRKGSERVMFIAAIIRVIMNLIRKNQNGSGQSTPRPRTRWQNEGD
jgi:hypothetical protein